MNKLNLISTILLLAFSYTLSAQWEETFGGSNVELGYSVLQTPNGDFLSCGYTTSFGNGTDEAVYIVRSDIDGTTIWEKTHALPDASIYGQSLIATSDGNYIIAGYIVENNSNEDFYLLKINPDGEKIWDSVFEGPGKDFGYRVIETSDNGFAIVGETRDLLNNQRDMYIVKTDASGIEEWNERIGGLLFDIAYSLIQTNTGEYILSGYETTVVANDTTRNAVLKRISTTGEELETYPLGEAISVAGAEVVLSDDDNFITAVYNDTTVNLKKVSPSGVIEWSEEIDSFFIAPGPSLIKTLDGGYSVVGRAFIDLPGVNDDHFDLKIVRTDNTGAIQWQKTHGSPLGNEAAFGVDNAQAGGFGILGFTTGFGAGSLDFYLLHTDALGNSLNNYINGNVYHDLDEDCTFDAGESGLSTWLIEAIGTTTTYYGLTDEVGNYEIAVKSGTYDLNLIPLNSNWQSCVSGTNLSLNAPHETATVDFPLQSVYECPVLEVDISTPFLRRCFDNRYTVHYCNDGTMLAEDAKIAVELDPFLNYIDHTNPSPPTIDGNTYTFDVGDLDIGDCGTFYIDVNVDCDNTLLGQTHSVEAHITPDTFCVPEEPCWDGGSIELDAVCIDDSVHFTVKNIGTATILNTLGYIVIEDHVILYEQPFNDNIDAQGQEVISLPVEGQTIRIEVNQPPCHPGQSTPAITVEGCGLVDPSEISLGYLTQYFEDDSNPFVSIDCQENIGSWDPNDKRGFPKGYEDQHFIEANQELDYHIRFQNTGSDTAFRVVIRDTLSEWLDPTDIQIGAASHEYTVEVYRSNILKFTFENINLPDSTTNEVASHGFVKYRIAQQVDNPVGTEIFNSAAIYFDYNVPVITNVTKHTIGENFIVLSTDRHIFVPGISVDYYPNPFKDETTFEIKYDNEVAISNFDTKTFHLHDAQGRLVRSESFDGNKFQFQRNGLAPGIYFFNIENNKELIIGGKLIAH